ncbi:hypothetical protein PanWU01x14_038830 [Parasponia andersonii]|uniref:Uncharacterized protein n=1 Tax=Parasponia andersonii TaxID=3476 RepID=A0A2P5DRN4_PARAD|nr:hypothetical protein PanWU01x14_038830 [Parasponia andersonii]
MVYIDRSMCALLSTLGFKSKGLASSSSYMPKGKEKVSESAKKRRVIFDKEPINTLPSPTGTSNHPLEISNKHGSSGKKSTLLIPLKPLNLGDHPSEVEALKNDLEKEKKKYEELEKEVKSLKRLSSFMLKLYKKLVIRP